MKPPRFAAALSLTLAAAVTPSANAQAPVPPRANPIDTQMKSMDTDGDGKLSAEEHAAGARRMFDTMDANKDGQVTAQEMDAAHEKVTGRKAGPGELSAADKIKTIDTDGDGRASAEEHRAGSRKMFDQMDTDKDGFLSKAELSAGHARKLHPAPQS